MNLRKLIFTENECYKSGKKHTVKGIMVHSTGANNPTLKRYVGPDDGLLGKNQYNNHWNNPSSVLGKEVCVHAFIGKLADGSVATYQTLPWDIVGWHSGIGRLGSAKNANNNGYIGFEICEDDLTGEDYFNKVYTEAVELCAYLCKQYNLDPTADGVIIGHYEGYARGIASNHGDPKNWFPKHGKSMDTFRAAVKALVSTPAPAQPAAPSTPSGSLYRVRKTWADSKSQKGAFSVLDNAKKCAEQYPGYVVFDASGKVIYPVAATPTTPALKSIEEVAREVLAGKWGNGTDRKNNLTSAGYDYAFVQAKVNEIVNGKPAAAIPTKKSVDEIAREVIAGKWGNGAVRKNRLTAEGYDYAAVQKRVNQLL